MATIESMTVSDLGKWLQNKGFSDELVKNFAGKVYS